LPRRQRRPKSRILALIRVRMSGLLSALLPRLDELNNDLVGFVAGPAPAHVNDPLQLQASGVAVRAVDETATGNRLFLLDSLQRSTNILQTSEK